MKHLLCVAPLVAGIAALPAAAAERTVTTADNGHSVVLKRGDALTVRLTSNPSTGYSWDVAVLPKTLRASGSEQQAPKQPAGPPIAGQSGTQAMHFQAIARGTGALRLAYRRPWEKASKPAGTFRLLVTVR
jgi:inhibitor of cysteine peptidase